MTCFYVDEQLYFEFSPRGNAEVIDGCHLITTCSHFMSPPVKALRFTQNIAPCAVTLKQHVLTFLYLVLFGDILLDCKKKMGLGHILLHK